MRNLEPEAQQETPAMSFSGIELEAQDERRYSPVSLSREGLHDADARCDAASGDEDPVEESERDGLLDPVARMLGIFLNQAFLS